MAKILSFLLSIFVFVTSFLGIGAKQEEDYAVKYSLDKRTASVVLVENPSTGYKWSCKVTGKKNVVVSSDTFVPSAKVGLIGAPGDRIYTFVPVLPGSCEVIFTYSRSGDMIPAKILTLTVEVKQNLTMNFEKAENSDNVQTVTTLVSDELKGRVMGFAILSLLENNVFIRDR